MVYDARKLLTKTTLVFDPEMGKRLKFIRQKLGLKQEDLARFLGVSQQAICNLEKGSVATLVSQDRRDQSGEKKRKVVSTFTLQSVIGSDNFNYLAFGYGKKKYEE